MTAAGWKRSFAPPNAAWMTANDLDMNTTAPVFTEFGREWIATSSKECRLWLLDTSALGGEDHLVGCHRQVDVHELQPVDLRIAVSVATLHMYERDIGLERWDEQQLLAGERTDHLLGFGSQLDDVRAEH